MKIIWSRPQSMRIPRWLGQKSSRSLSRTWHRFLFLNRIVLTDRIDQPSYSSKPYLGKHIELPNPGSVASQSKSYLGNAYQYLNIFIPNDAECSSLTEIGANEATFEVVLPTKILEKVMLYFEPVAELLRKDFSRVWSRKRSTDWSRLWLWFWSKGER